MKGSVFIFNCVKFLHYNCHTIILKRGESYIDSPDYIKTKQATINPINDDDEYFQYAATVTLNH